MNQEETQIYRRLKELEAELAKACERATQAEAREEAKTDAIRWAARELSEKYHRDSLAADVARKLLDALSLPAGAPDARAAGKLFTATPEEFGEAAVGAARDARVRREALEEARRKVEALPRRTPEVDYDNLDDHENDITMKWDASGVWLDRAGVLHALAASDHDARVRRGPVEHAPDCEYAPDYLGDPCTCGALAAETKETT